MIPLGLEEIAALCPGSLEKARGSSHLVDDLRIQRLAGGARDPQLGGAGTGEGSELVAGRTGPAHIAGGQEDLDSGGQHSA